MIEDDFYATVKLKNGEEIFAKVAACEEDDRTMLIISNPIIVSPIMNRGNTMGYKVEPWLKTTTEDMILLNMNDILTLTESSDVHIIRMYQNFVRQSKDSKDRSEKLSRKMGYIANVNDAKDILEKLYKKS
jgi:hypothetical protein